MNRHYAAILAVGLCLSAGAAGVAAGAALCAEPPDERLVPDAAGSGGPWSARPIAQRQADMQRMRHRVSTLAALAGLAESPERHDGVLVYGDTPAGERKLVAHDMHQLVERVSTWIGAEADCAVNWHPVVLFELADRESYELLAAAGFGTVDVTGPAAAVHVEGPAAYVTVGPVRGSPFSRALHRASATARAALHQCHAPGSLPAWAEAGLAWYWAINVQDDEVDDAALRRPGLRFIRGGGSVAEVLNAADDGHDAETSALIESIGYLAVRAMMERDEAATSGWAREVMIGAGWREAIEPAMGRSLDRFARELASWHRIND